MNRRYEILLSSTVLLATAFFLTAGLDDLREPTSPQGSNGVVLRAGHSANTDEPYHLGLKYFARLVEQRTNGSVRISIFPSLQLGSERAMIQGLMLGTLDIVLTANGSATNFVSELGVLDLPFLFEDREELYRALDGHLGKKLTQAAAQKGLRLLAFYDAGVRHLMTRKRPIKSFSDLKGLKIRTMPVPAHLASFNAFGANAIAVDYGELYGGLQTGLVDGAEAANTNYSRQKFYEVAPNWAQIGWLILVAEVFISDEAMNRLSSEEQSIVFEAAHESAIYERKLYAESDEAILSQLRDKGVAITYPTREPFKQAAIEVYDDFANTKVRRELLDLTGSDRAYNVEP